MKKVIIYSIVLVISNQILNAQDSYKKRYFIKDGIEYKEKFYASNNDKKSNKNKLVLKSENGTIDPSVKRLLGSKRGLLANVKFGGKDHPNRLYINPWLIVSNTGTGYIDRDKKYYFELSNRQSVKIKFKQWSFNALTVPLKIRFSSDDVEATTDANLGALFGHTWGTTNFVHRSKVDNKQYDSEHTVGFFTGVEDLEFSFMNEENTEVEVETAILSIGTGYLFSYQKFTLGVTLGLDFGLAENSSEWTFQGNPWLGASLGYSLFSF